MSPAGARPWALRRLLAAGRLAVAVLAVGVLAVGMLALGVLAPGAVPSATAAPRTVPLPPGGREGAWWFTSWRIADVWATGAQGQGVTVAVFDTGVNRVPELRGVVLPGLGPDGGDGRTDPDGHGTAMALLVAGQGGPRRLVGVAPRARILPVVSDRYEDGIRWAVDHGAKVVNMSFASASRCDPALADAVAYAIGKGAVLVAATGNEGAGNPDLVAPVNCPGVLGVGAIDADARPWARTQVTPFADVAAPGVHMRTIDVKGRAAHSDGTSDASALTAGAVALVWSKYPGLTNRQVVARLLATARDTGDPGRDDRTGYGIVRPYQAITTDVPADAPNPVFDEQAAAVASPSGTAAAPVPAAPPARRRILGPLVVVAGLVVLGGLVLAVVLAAALGRRRPGPPYRS